MSSLFERLKSGTEQHHREIETLVDPLANFHALDAYNGGLFFHGYGVATGEMWKSFRTAAMDYCVTEDQICMAVSGARATFGKFQDAMLQSELR